MVSGIVIGILKEQHSDHIVLADASRVPFPEGLVPEHLPSGSSVTILYSRDGAGFFFASRSRHTSWNCDWSSDVCSSDLTSRWALIRHELGCSPREGQCRVPCR